MINVVEGEAYTCSPLININQGIILTRLEYQCFLLSAKEMVLSGM